MKKYETGIQGCYQIHFNRFDDNRGYFQELYSDKYGICDGKQVSCSCSKKNTIRGIHCSRYYKLCSCVNGKMFDVVVDLRKESGTYLKWIGVWLNADDCIQLLIPPGCGHGFYSSEDNTILVYLQGGVYNGSEDIIIRWDDPSVGIEWPKCEEYIISDKDKHAPYLQR